MASRIVLALSRSLCDYNIYIRANETTLLVGRRGSRKETLISLELRIYDALAEWLSVPCIDTTGKRVEESLSEIMTLLGKEYG